MPAFWLCGSLDLLGEGVRSLLGDLYPSAQIADEPPDSFAAEWPERGVALGSGDRWLFVTASIGPSEYAAQALSAGAAAVLHLDSRPDEFRRAVDAVLRAERSFVPVEMVRWMASRATGRGMKPNDVHLTAREGEVLQLLARGCTNDEIADALTISINTVRTHLHSLAVKLEASNRAKIVLNARRLGIAAADEAEDDESDTLATA